MKSIAFILLLTHAAALAADPFLDESKRESRSPIRPGAPGKAPFWNENAKQFIWAPAFDFKPVKGAKLYRFTATSNSGKSLYFEATKPWAPLTPIWNDLPVGSIDLKVEAL